MTDTANAPILLPERTRALIDAALQEQQNLQTMAQMQQKQINDLLEAAREMLAVPDGWTIESTSGGFRPPSTARCRLNRKAPAQSHRGPHAVFCPGHHSAHLTASK